MMNKGQILIVLALLVLCCVQGCRKDEKGVYPQKNIFVYIFSSQGGGSDQWARHLASLMKNQLGVNVMCSNLPGAKGGTGAMRVWNAPHDGYSVLGASETALCFGVNDVGPTADHWEFFIAAGSPGIIAVYSDSPFKTIQELVAAAKEKPDEIKIGNSGQGKLWHIKAIQLEQGAGVQFQHVPYNGSAPAITALLSKEVDAISCSAGEVLEIIRGQMARPLIMTETVGMEFEGFGYIKPASEIYPGTEEGYKNLFQWLGFMIPCDVPAEVLEHFGQAFAKALNNPKTDEFMKIQMARKIGLWGKDAKELALNMQSVASWKVKELGLARKDPADLGIPKPH